MDCVLWDGPIAPDGYGKTTTGGLAHRQVWEEAFGPIPEGMHLHHDCENRACVNLDHLEMLTPTAHRRKHRAKYTVCPHGHPYSGVKLKANGTRQRICRTCNIEAGRRFRARKKERELCR